MSAASTFAPYAEPWTGPLTGNVAPNGPSAFLASVRSFSRNSSSLNPLFKVLQSSPSPQSSPNTAPILPFQVKSSNDAARLKSAEARATYAVLLSSRNPGESIRKYRKTLETDSIRTAANERKQMVSDAYGIPVADVFTGAGGGRSGVGGALGSVARFFSPVLRSGPHGGAEMASSSGSAAAHGSAYTSPHYQTSAAAPTLLPTTVVLPTEDDEAAEALRLVEEFERDSALALSASMSILDGTAGRSSASNIATSGGGRSSRSSATSGVTSGDTMPEGLNEEEQLAWIISLSERTHAAEAQMRTVGAKAPAQTMAQPPKAKSSFFGGVKK